MKKGIVATVIYYLLGSIIVTMIHLNIKSSPHVLPLSLLVSLLFIMMGLVIVLKNAVWIAAGKNVQSNKGQLIVHSPVLGIIIIALIYMLYK